MARFVIECPNCGRFAEARSGFFARRTIDCACGYIIHVRTDKMASRLCPHCGNTVVFDQSRGEKARCPVCGEPINTAAERTKMAEFTCRQCGVQLRAARSAATYTCPVCDCVNDVAERVKAEEIRNSGLASVIKYEGDGKTLVWKHPIEDFNAGSQLIVHENQEAVFFRDGQALDSFGPGRYTLETQQLPLLEKLYKLPTQGNVFHSEVYFVDLTTQTGIKWGTDSKVRLFDPASGMHLEIGASGEFTVRVAHPRKLLIKLVGTLPRFGQEEILGNGGRGFFRAMIMSQVKSTLAAAIRENAINILEIDEHLAQLGETLRERIAPRLEEYGLELPEFYVSRVVTPDDDPNFRRMKEQYAEQYLLVREEQIRQREAEAAARRKAVEAQTAAQMKIIGAQGEAEALKIRKQAEAEAYRMQAAAEAEEMRLKGYSYQQETARQVGLEAMKNGITGGEGASGALGDVASLGVTLGAMGSVVNMAREAFQPALDSVAPSSQALGAEGARWNCPECGTKDIASRFCPNCGKKRPEPANAWDCAQCGNKNIVSNFCPNCGAKRPVLAWECPDCGQKGIVSNFCPNCGCRRKE